MKIAVDVMGGDNAPHEIIKGSVEALKEINATLVLIGDEEKINLELDKYEYDKNKIEIYHTEQKIENDDKPVKAIRSKSESSMVLGLKGVRQKQFDGFISAGNTGALLVGSALKVGRIKGIERPALATALPTLRGFTVLLDSGANAECKPNMLREFAIMGNLYSELILDVKKPEIGLVNVGEEETKGTPLQQEAYKILKDEKEINFIGNIEGRDVFLGKADVIVCDGFTGNIILKVLEGAAKGFGSMLKEIFMKNTKTMLSGALIKKDMDIIKVKMDYREYGGAPLLGINGNIIKAHGSSDAKAIKNGIKSAVKFAEVDFVKHIASAISDEG